MENDRILFYDAIWITLPEISNRAVGLYGSLWDATSSGINNLFDFYLHVTIYWNVATINTRDAFYMVNNSIDLREWKSYGGGWEGSNRCGTYCILTNHHLAMDNWMIATLLYS